MVFLKELIRSGKKLKKSCSFLNFYYREWWKTATPAIYLKLFFYFYMSEIRKTLLEEQLIIKNVDELFSFSGDGNDEP